MTRLVCTTQAEVDAAAARGDIIVINDGWASDDWVYAYDNATVYAHGNRVGVRLIGSTATATGKGTIYRVATVEEWCDYEGLDIVDGHVALYKALGDDLTGGGGYGVTYPVGATVVAADWDPRTELRCGRGLHLCADPHTALRYHGGQATSVVECRVALTDIAVYEPDLSRVRCRAVTVVRVSHTVDAQRWPVEVTA